MKITICRGCGDVPNIPIVDDDGMVWCGVCASVHNIENTNQIVGECFWCGGNVVISDDFVQFGLRLYHVDCTNYLA